MGRGHTVGLNRKNVRPLLKTVDRETRAQSRGNSEASSTTVPIITKTTTMASLDALDMEDELPDAISLVNAARNRGAGVGLGDSLRSKENLAKRREEGSAAPSVVGEGGKGRKEKGAGAGAVEGKKVESKGKEEVETEAGGTRKSTRTTAAATGKESVGEARKHKKSSTARKEKDVVILSTSEDDEKRATNGDNKNKKNTTKGSEASLRNLDKPKAGDKENRTKVNNSNNKGLSHKLSFNDLLFDESNLGSHSNIDTEPKEVTKRTRSVASAASEESKKRDNDSSSKPTTHEIGKMGKSRGQETSGSSSGISSKSGKTDIPKPGPQLLDDLDCDKAAEQFWDKKETIQRRKPPAITYRSKGCQRAENRKFLLKRDSSQESKLLMKAKVPETVEKQRPKFLDPATFCGDNSTPAPRKNDRLPRPEFINPLLQFDISADSPDHLSNPKYENGKTNIPPSVTQIDLTLTSSSTTPAKKRKYISDSEESALSSLSNSPSLSPLSAPPTTDLNDLDNLDDLDDSFLITSIRNKCPICLDIFPPSFLSKYPLSPTSLSNNTRLQLDRCKKHKRFTAEEFCRQHNYPALSIEWQNLSKRIITHIPYLTEILENKRSSTYRDAVAKDLSSSKKGKRKLMDTDWQSHTPGYYGPRGAHIMLDVLMRKMADRIREVGGGSNDKVIAQGGVSAFVQSVLVPEVGVRLVMEDLDCSEEKAREVVKETVELGELVNDEEGEEEDYFLEDDEDKDGGVWVSV